MKLAVSGGSEGRWPLGVRVCYQEMAPAFALSFFFLGAQAGLRFLLALFPVSVFVFFLINFYCVVLIYCVNLFCCVNF